MIAWYLRFAPNAEHAAPREAGTGRYECDRVAALETFLAAIEYEFAPGGQTEVAMRDPADLPILGAAIVDGVDVIVTGDKDFLALTINRPLIVTARKYLDSVVG